MGWDVTVVTGVHFTCCHLLSLRKKTWYTLQLVWFFFFGFYICKSPQGNPFFHSCLLMFRRPLILAILPQRRRPRKVNSLRPAMKTYALSNTCSPMPTVCRSMAPSKPLVVVEGRVQALVAESCNWRRLAMSLMAKRSNLELRGWVIFPMALQQTR